MIIDQLLETKLAFVFDFDNTIYPEKDYLYQVYYMIGQFVEYQETFDHDIITKFLTDEFEANGREKLFDKLIELYVQYGFYYENLISITKKGMNGQAEIAKMMEDYRQSPPSIIDGEAVTTLLDYELQVGKNLTTGETWKIQLPKSNVLQFITTNGTKISARPSGTEPKIKFYFSVNTKLKDKASFDTTYQMLQDKIKAIISSMQLN